MACVDVSEHLHRRPFDRKSWQDPKQVDGEDPVRLRIVDDLIKSKRLDRLSRADIVKLLGEPAATDYFREYDLVYWLGPERRWTGIDSEYLAMQLDKNGIVRSYRIVRD